MAKFKVGDKVRLTRKFYEHYEGKEDVIERIDPYDNVFTYRLEGGGWVNDEVIELVPTHNEQYVLTRLFDAEAQIDELQQKVRALETVLADKQKLPGYTMNEAAEALTHLAKVGQATPNQRRTDVIKQAREFVAENTKHNGEACGNSGVLVSHYVTKPEFIVNNEKGTVVVLMKGVNGTNPVFAKGIAKCAPGDVFNADIGKAIALGRALGVAIPQEFYNAPKPTEFAVGQYTRGKYGMDFGKVTKISNGRAYTQRGSYWSSEALGAEYAIIADDTEAQYE